MDELTVTQARDLIMAMAEDDERVGRDGASAGGAAGEDADAALADAVAAAEADAAAEAAAAAATAPADAASASAQAPSQSFAEGNVGLGVDIVEVERMARILQRSPSFASRVFSPAEQDYCNGKANPATHYALRFAAKEAVVKALGTGFSEGIGVRDIEVERAKNGRPTVKLSGQALRVAAEQGVRDLSLSLSYTHTDAVACAMAVTEAAVKATEKRKDPMEELARQFKETRGILDEL